MVAGAFPYTADVKSGSLPDGLNLDAFGVLTGTPTTAGTFTFTVEATDLGGATARVVDYLK